ncbi:sugar phosphate isomerase/epimerase family protein [Ulvibacterium marinum]|uniref:Sugar phosphate isomerase/epimerase n=1 Tax=Ulvibacterium marinum TaxID=2419782 RepID=A0A3B0CAS5_9FLAO|nr:TIM barrel protein [Ulvibacterium marinum]RKN81754.1 sugar phosphate isomerase/epimerase [Ulvibacterium marinum]
MKRRKFVKSSLAGTMAMSLPVLPTFSTVVAETRFGVADASYMMRRYRKMKSEAYPPFTNALEMIEHCSSLGFGGMQVGVGGWDSDFSKKVKKRKEKLDIFLEAQIRLPKDEGDINRFDHEVKTAKETGIDVFRTACLSGRRYESFDSMQAFQTFKKAAINSIQLAEPIMHKHKVKLAVENHKDWRIKEMVAILKMIDSEWVGVTLDTGNNISLLEDPVEVVEALAPYAFSVHLKDMAVEEYKDGFLLSEVNLGEGYLDIEGMINTIKRHQPNVRFNLEMITRDPLKIPCLTEKYWATFDQILARELALYLHKIRTLKKKEQLPLISNRTTDEQLSLEVENNRTCLVYAKQNLGFK